MHDWTQYRHHMRTNLWRLWKEHQYRLKLLLDLRRIYIHCHDGKRIISRTRQVSSVASFFLPGLLVQPPPPPAHLTSRRFLLDVPEKARCG